MALLLLLVAAAAWWFLRRHDSASSGQVALEWHGSWEGRAVLPAQLAWCPINRVGTLEAISSDTGLIITLLEVDSLTRGPHQVVSAEIREESPRPSAVTALRWVSDSGVLLGFRSVSGVVDLQPADALASGSFEMRMRAPLGTDTLMVRGTFTGLPITAGAVGCP
jgi:hypothetical protein